MNKFALGVLTTLMFTTNEGKQILDKTVKVGAKMGDTYLKKNLGIDIAKILTEENEVEEDFYEEQNKSL